MLAQAGQVSVQLVDSIMIGHVGTTELAASSFANSIFIVGLVFGMGFTFGITPLVGKAVGENNFKRVGDLLQNYISLNTLVSIVLFIILYSLSYLMPLMGQVSEVANLAIPYYRILVVSMLPVIAFFTFKQFLEGLGKTKVVTIIIISGNIINIIVNYILIFGKLGFPELGLNGAGLSTLFSRVVMFILLVHWFRNSKYYVKYKLKYSIRKFKLREIIPLFWYSLPIGLQIIVEVIAFAAGGVMMGWLGEIALAAQQIALGISSFTFMIASGIGSATTIRISYQLGRSKFYELKMAGKASVHLAIVLMSLTAISFLFLRNYLPILFTNDREVINLASKLLLFAAAFQIVDAIQLVSISALRGLSDIRFSLWPRY
jgi:MATE family multidrug resistance protein